MTEREKRKAEGIPGAPENSGAIMTNPAIQKQIDAALRERLARLKDQKGKEQAK